MLSRIIVFMVYFYRSTLGLLLGGHCRFHPTCSQYMIDAVRKYGPLRGVWQGLRRIGRCHPFSRRGGYDPA